MNTLKEIVTHKRHEVDERRSLYPLKLLEQSIFFETPTVSLKAYLLRSGSTGIIAEIKRRSPSEGLLNGFVSVERTSIGYMQAGAAALSILTDKKFFGGSSEDLSIARKFNFCPILRKDFIIDEYQILESKSIGADAILLIAALLDSQKIKTFTSLAHSLGLEVLVEVRNREELISNTESGGDLMGINNRDLNTMHVSVETSRVLAQYIPPHMLRVAESGIHCAGTVNELRTFGFAGFLIGTAFMRAARPERAASTFMEELKGVGSANNSVEK
ncbi:MAG: indole-3-glycerol phosphate synthase TrpC [Cytophagales bacterium]|nr:indole-3-glycerol phosphate synthase TrpC [Cytophagales bacterium]